MRVLGVRFGRDIYVYSFFLKLVFREGGMGIGLLFSFLEGLGVAV